MRLIDADELKQAIPETKVDVFENCGSCTCLTDEQVKELIDEAPTIEALKEQQQKGEWIPVSERLPEEDGFYLVSGGGYIPWTAELITNRRTGLRGWSSKEVMANVEAWMPLPEPYETH